MLDIILDCITTLLTNGGDAGGGDSGVRSKTKNIQEENSPDLFADSNEDYGSSVVQQTQMRQKSATTVETEDVVSGKFSLLLLQKISTA